MTRNKSNLLRTLSLLTLVLLLGSGLSLKLLHQNKSVSALDNNFSNGITVDSTLDTPDQTIGDGICDDGAGNCTLRAAIEEANSDPDASVIEFGILEAPDFANNSENGYTIKPQSALPDITEQVTIDGYSQSGSLANTNPAPQPFNGTLLIEIDGSSAGNTAGLYVRADNSVIRGLVINQFTLEAVGLGSDNLSVWGCYLGTDPAGTLAKPNDKGIAISSPDSDNLQFGGLLPAERNLVSGNTDLGLSPNGGSDYWVIQGNYFGLDATGLAALPNSHVGGSGALSIDNSTGTIVGGTQSGAINVISGNLGAGIAPDSTDNLVIQGNYIGTDYTGLAAIPNSSGIGIRSSNNAQIGGTSVASRNVISGNENTGISLHGPALNTTIKGNYIGVGSDGTSLIGNESFGISIGPGVYNAQIGGITTAESNIIANNGSDGIFGDFTPTTDSTFYSLGNRISNNGSKGINLQGTSELPNDPLDSDAGPNSLLNHPKYRSVLETSGNTTVEYQLDVPAGDYRIEFFSNATQDASGAGEGEDYLGFQNITSTGSGIQIFTHSLTGLTGITNLAMTATEIDGSTLSGFGATSEFGGQIVETDISISTILTNPQQVAPGTILNYSLTYTNNGFSSLDLSQFAQSPMLYYIVHPDLVANNLGDPGPFPGTFVINNASPDAGCLWAQNGYGIFSGSPTHSDYNAILCISNGSGELQSGESINFNFNFTLSNSSSLNFGTYAFAVPPSTDPDANAIAALNSIDVVENLASTAINNFASAVYPLPSEAVLDPLNNADASAGATTALSSTGGNALIFVLLSVVLISISTYASITSLGSRTRS